MSEAHPRRATANDGAQEGLRAADAAEDAQRTTVSGLCCYGGHGAAQDHARAFKLFQQEAAGGSADSMYWLGECYANGHGVDQNAVAAFQHYYCAAQAGNALAQLEVGRRSQKGLGTLRDYSLAYYWL